MENESSATVRAMTDDGNGTVTCTCPYCNRSIRISPDMLRQEPATCLRCGHSWFPRNGRPDRCPRCRSVLWDTSADVFMCKRCSHVWAAKKSGTPRKCPKCQSTLWNEDPDAEEEEPERRIDETTVDEIMSCHQCGLGLFDAALELDVPVLDVLYVYRKNSWF